MNKPDETYPRGGEAKTPTVPTHGNWGEERGFGQQTSASSDVKQYDLRLTDLPPSSNE